MKPGLIIAALTLLLATSSLRAQAYVTCKPCGAPPLEMSLDQAELIVLGRIGSVQIESEGKGQGGEARLKIRVLQWLKKPSKGDPKALKTKGLTELPVKIDWDGACIPPPPSFEKGQRWVFFLNRAPKPQGASAGELWEGTPGHCSLKYADPKGPEGKLESLKALLRSR